MGLLDQLAGQAMGALGGSQGGQADLMKLVMGLIQNHEGGLGGLLGKFNQAGLGDQAASWVGTGANLPVSGDQIKAALGEGTIGDIAGKLGMSSGDASGALANLLPGLIDKLTPQGQVTEGDALSKGLAALAGKFFS
ncbi:MAG TPA: YidB family protein [Rhodocyclaceae bacterium]|nr:YidB family protein [Rhodocyclaceae bacterium]